MKIYFQNQCSVKNDFRAPRPIYGVHNRPTERTIRETINNQSKSYHCIRKNELFGAVYWQAASSDRISLKNAEAVCITVNDTHYRAMINEFSLPKIQDIGVVDLWFQQDGATCHTAGEAIDLLKENFHEQKSSQEMGP